MTKKDYELIAAVIRKFSNGYLSKTNAAILRLDFLYALQETNPRFDADKFLKASTPTVEHLQ